MIYRVTGTFVKKPKNDTALKTASRAYFGIFITGTQKGVTGTFYGQKLSRPFFRCHGNFLENCHGHENICHGKKKH